jgi:hypothetical protein
MGKDGVNIIYGFVIFSVLLVIGISMISNVLSISGNDNATVNDGALSGSVQNVVSKLNSGFGLLVIGIGILAAVAVLKGMDYF